MVNLSSPPVTDEPIVKRAKFETLNIKDAVHEFKVPFFKINENAKAPFRSSEFAAGADLHSAEDFIVPKKALKVALPKGTYARVAPRSGLAFKNRTDIGAGVADEDYREEVKVLLFSFGENDFNVKQVFQLVFILLFLLENYGRAALDEDYSGEVRVLLFNFSETPFEVKKGGGIAHILCEKVASCTYEEVKELSETTHGEGGFGSTGTDKIDAGGDAITIAIEKAISFKKIDEDAQEPVYGTPFAAGAEFYSYEETTVHAGEKALISTGTKLLILYGKKIHTR
uniref:Deoxyuridine 5'-triphosphate nucleotidohydrolase n=1 Tax=Panagrolaimus davidi TaxID=227884 RepID=A0A914P7F6_9BILA